jgi:putative membrane protein insertion efficiency factor
LRRAGVKVALRKTVVFPVWLYRKILSPAMKQRCIYYPSCSEYFERAVIKHGVVKGSLKGCYRILRCNPFAAGGYDPP